MIVPIISYVIRVQRYVTRVLLKSDTAINIHDLVSKSRKSKSTYQREWYKKLTPEQKKARNERQKCMIRRQHDWKGREHAKEDEMS